jgi:formylglycine-generating enzyme required for sulfatase activity
MDGERRRIDRELARAPPGGRRWLVSREGHTLAVVHRPEIFRMGSPESEPDRDDDETAHDCLIPRSFAVATHEVTAEQFQRFLDATGRTHRPPRLHSSKDPEAPVVSVSWLEAAQYCRWLSEREGVDPDEMCYPPVDEIKEGAKLPADYLSRTGYRLPTEAEWEYACRAGAATARAYGSSPAMLRHYGWYIQNSGDHTWPVGRLKPNDLGLFDMYGNAWEWCQNQLKPYPAGPGVSEDREDQTTISLRDRVMRGGAFGSHDSNVRSARRYPFQVTYLSVGLRVVRTVR